MKNMRVKVLPSKSDYYALKSLSLSQRAELLSKGFDVEELERSMKGNLNKASAPSGSIPPVGGVKRDRSNLIPEQRTVTRNGRQQQMTVWVNPNRNKNQNDEDKQSDDEDQANTKKKNQYIADNGTHVSLTQTDNNNFPYAITVIEPDGTRSIKHVINYDLAMKEIKNLVGNVKQAEDRADSQNANAHGNVK